MRCSLINTDCAEIKNPMYNQVSDQAWGQVNNQVWIQLHFLVKVKVVYQVLWIKVFR